MSDTPYGKSEIPEAGWDVKTGPGVTALGLAAARAVETGRPDRLIEDPFAQPLFEASESDLPMLVAWPEPDRQITEAQALHLHGSRYIGLRTRFYDDILQAATSHGIRQAVLLGAGLDTRAFRLNLPGEVLVLEVDQPGVLAHKQAVLHRLGARPRCRRIAVGADLHEDWPAAVQALGFDTATPTAWILEGLVAYLPSADRSRLLERITDLSASASTLALDRIAGDLNAGERLVELSQRSGIDMTRLLKGGEDDIRGLLESHGWEVSEQDTNTLARRYGRDLRDPFSDSSNPHASEPPWLHTIFVTASRTAS